MIKLRTRLNILLKTIHPRVHFNVAPDTTAFPYIVYDLPNSLTNEEQEVFVLDVDIWDNTTDTTAIETLAEQVWSTLHKYRYLDSDIQFSIYRMNRLTLTDDDTRIRRRKLMFEVRYFDRNL